MIALTLSIIIAFFISYTLTPAFIRFLNSALIVGEDQHKKSKPLVATSGGVCFTAGIIAGIFSYITLQTFVFNNPNYFVELLTGVSVILIAMFTGFLDDIGVRIKNNKVIRLNLKKGEEFGLKKWQKPLLTLPAAVPLMAIKAGKTIVLLPFLGQVDLGLFFTLVLIPIGFVGCTNMVNLLGGFNGSEAGMGLVYLSAIAYFAYIHNLNYAAIILCLCAVAAILGYIKYNWNPAKILAGDSSTYTLGAIAASAIFIANMEKAGIIIMMPFIIEGILKLRSLIEMKKFSHCLGILQEDGTIKCRYNKIYSIAHILQRFNLTETQISIGLILIQTAFALIPILLM